MQGQNKQKDTADSTLIKCALDHPSNDIGALTSMDNFVFLCAVLNSTMAFLSTKGVKRTEDNFVELFFHAVSTRHKHGWKVLAQCLHNSREQGLYFGDIKEMMCEQMSKEKTKDKK